MSFAPMSVTTIVTLVYFAILIPIIVIHETVPPVPTNPTYYHGLNLSEAWLDLAELSNGFHPYNSRRNDEVRDWLLRRIDSIFETNGVQYTVEGRAVEHNLELGENGQIPQEHPSDSALNVHAGHKDLRSRSSPIATVFNDAESNYTSTALTSIGVSGRKSGISTYFEGNNIIVYIRGTEDEEGEWWNSHSQTKKLHGKGGVMVNAHFDSVSTGYGATDDGVGVITALQLIRFFTTPGNTPKKGVVALFNNNEEDGLYGAKAFLSHPMASFVHTFLNLEGAGAGGRATLFRSTDTEVTRAYCKAENPFGSVVSADGFAMGFVRSETDFVVFREEGFRGLDVAFWGPRSRYHTDQDSAKFTSRDSVWHMLSGSVATMKALTSDTSKRFTGPRGDKDGHKVENGRGNPGVWFDLFGQVFAVFQLRTLFAWSLTLLIASPLILIIITYFLVRSDKYYFFAGAVKPESHEEEKISLAGWRGAFRFPVVLIISSALTIGAAFLLRKVNPLIIYSSQYSVWAMSMTLFFSSFWFLMAGCNFVRPSALHRGYALIWMFVIGWFLLIGATVTEDRMKLGGGYIFVFYEATIFLATLITLCELFALQTKRSVVDASHEDNDTRAGLDAVPNSDGIVSSTGDTHEDAEATETTPLVGESNGHSTSLGTTFANRYRQVVATTANEAENEDQAVLDKHHPFGQEQKWSAKLPTWTWLLQFLLIGPFMLVILGQIGLFLAAATAQTGADGSPLLVPYAIIAAFSILVLLPLGPFMHRITHHIPIFFFLVFIGTLIYNLTAFPFSGNNRYKAYFQQTVDLDTGLNQVTIGGIEEHVLKIIGYVPSAAGQKITCTERPQVRSGMSFCHYHGIAPSVIRTIHDGVPPEKGYGQWLNYTATRIPGENKATFHINGLETRGCALRFDDPFTAFHVHGAAPNDGRWNDVPKTGSDQIKLWHRDWNQEWVVDVEWPVSDGKNPGDEGRSGRVVCLWSDHNRPGMIPALDEVQGFAPEWAAITKLAEGLVEGSKRFMV